MPLVKCPSCQKVAVRAQRSKSPCEECRAASSAPAELVCAACGRSFAPKNQRQRFCERKACKPVYQSKGIPRSDAPLVATMARLAAESELYKAGVRDIYKNLTGVSRCAFVVAHPVTNVLLRVEVQTVQGYTNGDVRFPPAKSPDSDIRAYVAFASDNEPTVWLEGVPLIEPSK